MKIKSLPIKVLALIFGISILSFSVKSFAQNATNSPMTGQFDDKDSDELKRKQVNQVTGTIDLNDVKAAQLQALQFPPRKKSTASMNWKKLGPNNMAGAITAIVSEDLSGKNIFAGSKHGGVFKSTDGGNSWAQIPVKGDVNLFVTCLAYSDTKKMYVGTGGDFPSQGLWSTENGNALELEEGTDQWGTINKIAVYTKDGKDYVYAATEEGLMFYDGTSWTLCSGYNEVNILVNGDFSTWGTNGRPYGWSVTASDKDYIVQSSIAHSAPYSCQLVNTESTQRRLFSNSYRIISDYTYHVRFWVRGSGEIKVGIWNGKNKDDENNYSYHGETFQATDAWTMHEVSIPSPDGITGTGQFVFSYKNTSGSHILVDDVEFFVGDMKFDTEVTDIDISGENCVITSLVNHFGSFCYVSNTLASNTFNGAAFDTGLSNIENIAVAAAPSNPDTVYISVAKNDGSLAGAYVSGDRGATWRKIFQSTTAIDPLGKNGNNINRIFVDPLNSGAVYIVSYQLWQGIKYTETGFYDFGLQALSGSLHSNVHDIFIFESSKGSGYRNAYVATDGGVTLADINIFQKYYASYERNRNFHCGSFSHIAPHNKQGVIGGTPTLGAQAIGDSTNNKQNARPIWAIESGSRYFINEGQGGPCFTSWINERFYIMTNNYGAASEVRRSDDRGYSYQPASSTSEQWLTSDMRTGNTYNRPMLMWETFDAEYTADTVEFKAIWGENYEQGDLIVYPRSKNADYPMEVTVDVPFSDGETRKFLDKIQNRLFYGQEDKIWMTRGAINLSNIGNLIEWYKIANLREADTASCFAISDNGDHLFVGSIKGNIYRISNILKAYDSLTAIIDSTTCVLDTLLIHTFDGRYVTSISVNPTDYNNVIVTLGNYGNDSYVYESSNALGANVSFTSIQEGLPKAPTYASLISKGGDRQYKIVGTEFGLYYKQGSGAWVQDELMGHIPVMSLVQATTERHAVDSVKELFGKDIIKVNYPNNDKNYLGIFAGTYGSGVFYFNDFVREVGIDTVDPDKNGGMLTVYPNPVSSQTTLEINMNEGTAATVQIYDVQGRCIQEFQTSSKRNELNFSDKAAGIYLIRVSQGGKTQSTKVVKY